MNDAVDNVHPATRLADAPPAQFDSHEAHIFVSVRRKFSYASGQFGLAISENLLMNFVMVFYPVILKLNPAVVGAALLWPRIWDAISDPIMGQLSDRTRSRWGRRRPYLLFGAPALAIATFLVFAPPASLSQNGLMVYIFVMAAIYYTAYTVVAIPYGALGSELSIEYNERTRVQAWRSIANFVATIFTVWIWWLTQRSIFPNERVGSMWVSGMFSVGIMVALWMCFSGTREESELQTRGGLPLVQALRYTFSNKAFLILGTAYFLCLLGLWGGFGLSVYVNISYVFGGVDSEGASAMQGLSGTIFSPCAILGSLFWGYLGTRLGKKAAFLSALFLVAATSPLAWFLYTPVHPNLQLIMGGLQGFFISAIVLFPNAMVADICDIDELQTGCRREGAYNGILSFTAKLGFSGTFLVTGLLLKLSGFDERLDVQSDAAIWNIRMLLSVVPTLVIGLVVLCILFYPVSERRIREAREVLEARRRAKVA